MKKSRVGPVLLVSRDEDELDLFGLAVAEAELPAVVFCFLQAKGLVRYLAEEWAVMPVLIVLQAAIEPEEACIVLRWLRSKPEFYRVPVVLLSGTIDSLDLLEAMALGVSDHRLEPTNYEEMLALVRELGDQWLSAADAAGQPDKFCGCGPGSLYQYAGATGE